MFASGIANGAQEVLATRNVFYVGGQYVYNDILKGSLKINQMYVEQLIPAGGNKAPFPVVFFHGGGLSGATWLNTPDNRQGWASYFLEQGHTVYLADLTSVARSSRQPYEPTIAGGTADRLSRMYTAPGLHDDYPESKKHTQWPGTGTMGDPIFDAFFASVNAMPIYATENQNATRLAGCALLESIGPAAFITHASGSPAAWAIADSCPDKVKSIVAIDPAGPTFETYDVFVGLKPARPWGVADVPLQYDPPVNDPATDLVKERVGQNTTERRSCLQQQSPAKQLVNVRKVPVLVMTGEASPQISYNNCTSDYLKQAGVDVTHWDLAKQGLFGNGHYLFLEKNNIEIVKRTKDWIFQAAGLSPKPQKRSRRSLTWKRRNS
ncbi:MAG: hypothetical protein M1817_001807 [Caeruleum heppii]|nr:MAG: hypothetical protein M1817_001807 [Caeruleum heppii]